jgi:predicted transcriptional regulator
MGEPAVEQVLEEASAEEGQVVSGSEDKKRIEGSKETLGNENEKTAEAGVRAKDEGS